MRERKRERERERERWNEKGNNNMKEGWMKVYLLRNTVALQMDSLRSKLLHP